MKVSEDEKKAHANKWKKRTIPFLSEEEAKDFDGIYLSRRENGENTNEATGEVKERFTLIFKKPDSEDKFQVWENGGLKNAMAQSDVQEGEHIRVQWLGKVPMKSKPGQSVNQYDIFSLS